MKFNQKSINQTKNCLFSLIIRTKYGKTTIKINKLKKHLDTGGTQTLMLMVLIVVDSI